MFKCKNCIALKEHRFSDCLSTICNCLCVNEIYKIQTNLNEEDISMELPVCFNITQEEYLLLPNVSIDITKFSKINREEWLKDKVDKRSKKYRKFIKRDKI